MNRKLIYVKFGKLQEAGADEDYLNEEYEDEEEREAS